MDTNEGQYHDFIRLCGILPCDCSQGGHLFSDRYGIIGLLSCFIDSKSHSRTLHLVGGLRKESRDSRSDRKVRRKAHLRLGNRGRELQI